MTLTIPSERAGSPPTPRIVRIAVKKLFGALDHPVELKVDDRVTVVHGINGVGKTKLLELTSALTRGHLSRLMAVPFAELRLELDDETAIEVIREIAPVDPRESRKKHGRRRKANIEIRRVNIRSAEVIGMLSPESITDELNKAHQRLGVPPWVEPLGDGTWFDSRMNRVIRDFDLARMYGVRQASLRRSVFFGEKAREVIPCEPAHLIETQRLLRIGNRHDVRAHDDEESSLVMTVHELAAELKQNIAAAQNEFFQKTQALDRTLTERVLKAEMNTALLGENLRARLEALGAHRERLERVGLLDAGIFGPTLAPADAEALRGDRALMIAVHTDDAEEKFRVLDPLATRLELLLGGMNEKLASPKRLVLNLDRELSVQRHGEAIPLDQLSSGEQHELVLLYDLAFRVKPNTLVLIDEPELSLHPLWQQQFLDDILRIAKNGAFDVLLATHSPYIIGNRIDLCVELKPEART